MVQSSASSPFSGHQPPEHPEFASEIRKLTKKGFFDNHLIVSKEGRLATTHFFRAAWERFLGRTTEVGIELRVIHLIGSGSQVAKKEDVQFIQLLASRAGLVPENTKSKHSYLEQIVSHVRTSALSENKRPDEKDCRNIIKNYISSLPKDVLQLTPLAGQILSEMSSTTDKSLEAYVVTVYPNEPVKVASSRNNTEEKEVNSELETEPDATTTPSPLISLSTHSIEVVKPELLSQDQESGRSWRQTAWKAKQICLGLGVTVVTAALAYYSMKQPENHSSSPTITPTLAPTLAPTEVASTILQNVTPTASAAAAIASTAIQYAANLTNQTSLASFWEPHEITIIPAPTPAPVQPDPEPALPDPAPTPEIPGQQAVLKKAGSTPLAASDASKTLAIFASAVALSAFVCFKRLKNFFTKKISRNKESQLHAIKQKNRSTQQPYITAVRETPNLQAGQPVNNPYPKTWSVDKISKIENINKNMIQLAASELAIDELMEAAPYLKFVDARDAFDGWESQAISDFLKKCQNAQVVYLNSEVITTLPFMDKCTELYVTGCSNLQDIPKKGYQILDCRNCPNLKHLFEDLNRQRHPFVSTIPIISHSFDDSPLKRKPTFIFYKKDLVESPLKILLNFRIFWLQEKSFPNINTYSDMNSYMDSGMESETSKSSKRISFIPNLIKHLVMRAKQTPLSLQGAGFVLDDPDKPEMGYQLEFNPSYKQDFQIEAFQALGIIFAECWRYGITINYLKQTVIKEDSNWVRKDKLGTEKYVTGSVFDARLFQAITSLSEEDLKNFESEEGIVSDELKQKVLGHLGNSSSRIPRNENRALPTLVIAKQIRDIIGADGWQALINEGPDTVRRKIQGEFTRKEAIANIHLCGGSKQQKNWLKNWAEHRTISELEDLFVSISGTPTIPIIDSFPGIQIELRRSLSTPTLRESGDGFALPNYETEEEFQNGINTFITKLITPSSDGSISNSDSNDDRKEEAPLLPPPTAGTTITKT